MLKDYNIIAQHFSETRSRNWLEFEDFVKLVKPKTKVLDLGCGNGRLFKLLQDKQVNYLGIDNSEKLIEIAKKTFSKGKMPVFKTGDITNPYTWKNIGEFDDIFCLAVFHHFISKKDQQIVLKRIFSHLKPQGLLFLTVWNLWQSKFLFSHLSQLRLKQITVPYHVSDGQKIIKTVKRHLYCFTKGQLSNLVNKTDFIVKDIYYSKQGKKTNFLSGYNLCLIAKKC